MIIQCKQCIKDIDVSIRIGSKVVIVCPDCNHSNKFIIEKEKEVEKPKGFFKRLFSGVFGG